MTTKGQSRRGSAELPELPYHLLGGIGKDSPVALAIRNYGEACRAQARAELIAELHSYADRQYCIGIEQMRRPECLGWEAKVKTGEFKEAEMAAHARANKAFGAHFGIYAAIKERT